MWHEGRAEAGGVVTGKATFNEFVLRQLGRDDEVGVLAWWVLHDPCWPAGKPKLFMLQMHLRRHGQDGLLPALNKARIEWYCLRGWRRCEEAAA
jgi:hypothetical protein